MLEAGTHDDLVAGWGQSALTRTRAAGVESVGALEQTCRKCSGAENDVLLLALIGLHQDGERFAGRLLLQLFLGKIIRLSLPSRPNAAVGECEADALAAFWSVMSSYRRERRPRSVAANLALDTLHQVRVHPKTLERLDWQLWGAELLAHQEEVNEQDPTCQVLVLIRDGLAAGAISVQEAQLLASTYAPDAAPLTSAQLGQQMGLAPATLRQRTSRAVARLSAFVHRDVCAPQRRLTADITAPTPLPAWIEEHETQELMGACTAWAA